MFANCMLCESFKSTTCESANYHCLPTRMENHVDGIGSPTQTQLISAAALREVHLVSLFDMQKPKEAIKLLSRVYSLLPDLTNLITQWYRGFEDVQSGTFYGLEGGG